MHVWHVAFFWAHLDWGGKERNRVKLDENRLILGQIYFTLLHFPSLPLNPNGPLDYKVVNCQALYSYLLPENQNNKVTHFKKKVKKVKKFGFLLMETTSPIRDFFQNVRLSFFLTISLTILHNNGLSYFFGSAKKR